MVFRFEKPFGMSQRVISVRATTLPWQSFYGRRPELESDKHPIFDLTFSRRINAQMQFPAAS
jgi:hypothetical protein